MKTLINFKLAVSICLLLSLLSITYIPLAEAAAVGTSYNVKDMPGARSGQGQSTLKDGRILVTGGVDGAGTYTSTAWIYNPGTNSWSAVANMPGNRSEHGQSTLPDGRVLVTGGYSANSTYTATAWIYDPGLNSWSAVTGMPANRVFHTQSTLQDGKVMVNGGYGGSGGWAASNAWIYNPVSNTWSTMTSMPDLREGHAQSTLNDGRVFVTLGDDGSTSKQTAWVYSVAGNYWSTVAIPPALRCTHAQSTLPDGRVLITGGYDGSIVKQNTVWTYNPSLNTFKIEANLPLALAHHAQSPLADGRVLITGGRDSSNVVQGKAFFYSFNNPPGISLSTTTTQRINETGAITLSGKVNDLDRNNVAITATIGGITKIININPAPTTTPGSDNWSLTWSGSEVPEGNYTNILITANDGAGGQSTISYTDSLIVDKTLPSTPSAIVTSGTIGTNSWYTSDAAFTLTPGTDGGSGVLRSQYKIGAGTWTDYLEPVTVSNEGTNNISVQTIDNAGNISAAGSLTVKIDKTAPSVPSATVTSGILGANGWYNSDAAFTLTPGTDEGSGVQESQYKIGAGAWTDYNGQVNITAEGTHTINVRTQDYAGNISDNGSLTVKLDKSGPTAALVLNNGQYLIIEPISEKWGPTVAYQVYAVAGQSGLDKLVLSNTANFDEPTEVFFAGANQLSGSWTTLNDFIVGREKTVFAQVYSNSGLSVTVSASVYRNVLPTVDAFNVEPKLAAIYPTFNWDFSDNDSDQMNGGEVNIYQTDLSVDRYIPVTSATSAWNYDPLAYGSFTDGNYLAKIKVKDSLGSWSEWTEPVAFVMDQDIADNVEIRLIDQPDPTIVLDASGESFTYITNTVLENSIYIQDSKNNTVRTVYQGIQQPNRYTFAWDNKNDSGVLVQSGSYQVYLQSWDGVNQFNTLIATIQIDVDAPIITINQPGQSYFKAAVPIAIASTDNMSLGSGTVKVINQAGVEMISWDTATGNLSVNYTPPADGTYLIEVTQRDAVNNQTKAARQFVYKTVGPSLSLLYPLASNTNEAAIAITVSDVYLDKLYLDGLELPLITIGPNLYRTVQTVTLAPGDNSFTFEAFDFAGNVAKEAVRISYQPPARPISGGGAGEPLSEADIISQELGMPLAARVIDLRKLAIDPVNGQPATGRVQILSAETSQAKIEISGNGSDLANLDFTKALNYDQLQTVFSELEGRLDLEFSTFQDAVGIKAVVIGKDGSFNELQIELPFLTKYTLPDGLNPAEWGVFKFEPKIGQWSMIPSYYTGANTLEARIGIGIYGVKKIAEINYADVLMDNWVYQDLKIISNMGSLPVIEKNLFEREKMIAYNEVLNMTKVVASSQKFSQLVETANTNGFKEQHITRTELVVLLNTILETELKVTLLNRPGNLEYSKTINFRLNKDQSKLNNFIDDYAINPLYKNDVAVAVNYGLIIGLPGYQLAPNDYVTRAEAVTMLKRYAYFAGDAKLKNLLSNKG